MNTIHTNKDSTTKLDESSSTYSSSTYSLPQETKKYQMGWVCPKCGRVLAPWVAVCPCHRSNGWSVCFSEQGS